MIDSIDVVSDSAFPKNVSDVGQPAQSINSNLFHPRSPVRIERYLKPKENLSLAPFTAPNPTDRKVARRGYASSLVSRSKKHGDTNRMGSNTGVRMEIVDSLLTARRVVDPRFPVGVSPPNPMDGTVPQFENITTALSFNETSTEMSLQHNTVNSSSSSALHTPDSLEDQETSTPTTVNSVSPRFFNQLPIKLEELLSSSGEHSEEAFDVSLPKHDSHPNKQMSSFPLSKDGEIPALLVGTHSTTPFGPPVNGCTDINSANTPRYVLLVYKCTLFILLKVIIIADVTCYQSSKMP